MRALLFIGTSLVGAQYIEEAIKPLGLIPIFLVKIEEYSGAPRRALEACKHYYEADVNSLDDILRAIREHDLMRDVVAITSLLDETLQHACIIAEKFGIAGPDPKLIELSDKTKVQQIIPEFCPPGLTFKFSELSDSQLNLFITSNTIFDEFILKPGISSGAVGTSILNRTMTVEQIKNEIQVSAVSGAITHQSWVVQPRLIGRLHSLEGFVSHGQVFPLGFSRRIRQALTESATEFPVDNELSQSIQQRCQDAVKALVQRSGYKNGYFHCEFIITSDNAYFIDGNIGRIAGAAIIQQIGLVYGSNPADIYRHVFDLGLFKGVNTPKFSYKRVRDEATLSINYCLKNSAVVENVIPPENTSCFHMQIADNGKEIPAVGKSDSAWVGFLAGFRENALADIQRLVINTNQGTAQPFYVLTE